MSRLLEGKVGLVTGAARGIGAATAAAMAAEGASVIVSDLDADAGPRIVDAIRAAGGDAHFQRTDVRMEDDVRRLVDVAVERFGRLDCAVNNAAVMAAPTRLSDVELDDWNHIVETNLTGVFLCLKHELRQLLSQGEGGAIVNLASGLASMAWPGCGSYCATKAGILQVTRSAALDYAADRVRINAVLPGVTETDGLNAMADAAPGIRDFMLSQIPYARFGRPEEVAQCIVWLCSDRASYVTGAPLAIDGGTLAGPPAPGSTVAS